MLLGLIFFDRRQQFEYPENSGQHGIDVRNVQNGDTIQFTPFRFTWLHLDTSPHVALTPVGKSIP